MFEERRSSPRAPMSGVLVTYESAAGDRVEADTHDLAPGGLFVRTTKALGVGKRMALDLQVARDQAPWSALGRVIWVRERGESADRPPGMGVKLIDADEAVVAAIERMVERVTTAGGERTDPGIGQATTAPVRERTILGIGGLSSEPEPAMAIDLVTRERRATAPPGVRVAGATTADSAALAEPVYPRGRRRRGAGRWAVVLLVLVIAAAAAYAYSHGALDTSR